MTGKVSDAGDSSIYTYNLQNRLQTATITRMEGTSLVDVTSAYVYNQSGIRVGASTSTKIDGGAPEVKNTVYLTDPANFTGYSQVLEETVNGTLAKSYTLGDDVLAQTAGTTTSYLQYDGHGSTRLLTSASSAIASRFNYDAYGKNLFSANITSPAATDMLYSGEQFDPNLQMQYLRARYYDQNAGVFNRLDDYMGDNQDPQSLHKYAYCHGDGVNLTDPTGESWLGELTLKMGVQMQMMAWSFSTTLTVIRGVLATINIVAFLTSAEYREIFVSTAGSPYAAANILAADVRVVGAGIKSLFSFAQSASTAKNFITVKYNTGSLKDFWKKCRQLQQAAEGGGLTVINNPSSLRPDAKKAQAAYRTALKSRYIKYLQNALNYSSAEAQTLANTKFSSMHADHILDIQIGGAPTDVKNLQMLDGSVNTSLGKQIQLEIERLGLVAGDIIEGIIIQAPPL